MKVIFMNCNIEKSNRKKREKVLKELFSIKATKKLEKMNTEEINKYFEQVNNDLDLKTKDEWQNMYLNYFLVSKKANNKLLDNKFNEIACTLEADSNAISLSENKNLNNNFIKTVKNVLNKLMVLFNKKGTKRIIFSAIAIALTLSCYRLEYAVAPCFTGSGVSGIDTAFYYIRMISGVICFVCMTIEIVQNAVQGDVRVIWYVVAKYLAIMVAILSFRKIFNIIDGIFNG